MKPAAILICLLVAGAPAAYAQQAVATGRVIRSDGQPAPGVPVRVEGPKGESVVVTDAKGQWHLYNLPPGSYEIKLMGTSQGTRFTVEGKSAIDQLLNRDQPTFEAPALTLPR